MNNYIIKKDFVDLKKIYIYKLTIFLKILKCR